jgi:hypothetical protein
LHPYVTPKFRILSFLASTGKAHTRQEIQAGVDAMFLGPHSGVKHAVDLAWMNSYIGAHNLEIRARNDEAEGPCLLTQGFVDEGESTRPTKTGGIRKVLVYSITAKGREALAVAGNEMQ